MTLGQIQRKINSIDLEVLATEAIKSSAYAIEKANRRMLFDGKRADGSDMPEYKSNRKGKPKGKDHNRVVLRDTGDFQDSILISDDARKIIAKDEKTQLLQKKYGNTILGLDTERRIEVVNDKQEGLRKAFVAAYRNEIKKV